MTRNPLAVNRANEIAHALRNIIEDERKRNEKPFVVGWENRAEQLGDLTENIIELYNHPRKNAELLYFLNELANSYYIGGNSND